MNLTDYLTHAFKRLREAHAQEKELRSRAERALAEGRTRKASELIAFAERAVPAAEAYLEGLRVEGV